MFWSTRRKHQTSSILFLSVWNPHQEYNKKRNPLSLSYNALISQQEYNCTGFKINEKFFYYKQIHGKLTQDISGRPMFNHKRTTHATKYNGKSSHGSYLDIKKNLLLSNGKCQVMEWCLKICSEVVHLHTTSIRKGD